MTFKEVGACIAVVVVTAYVFNCQGKRSAPSNLAVDSFNFSVKVADSVERVLQPQIAAWRDSANKNAESADTLRNRAQRLQRSALRLRDSLAFLTGGAGATDTTTPIAPGESPAALLGQAFDSLLAAYGACELADQSCQRVVQIKDSLIAAQDTLLVTLRNVRASAIRAVESTQCTIVFGIKCPSRTTVGLIALGLGVVGGYALAR